MKHWPLAFCILFIALSAWAEDLTVNGTTYTGATIKKENDAYVKVLHSSGVARVPISDLPSEWKTKLGFDSTKAAAAMAQEEVDKKNQAELVTRQAALQGLREKAFFAEGRVSQVFDGGVLGSFSFMEIKRILPGQSIPNGERTHIGNDLYVVTAKWSDFCRIEGINTTSIVDGSSWKGVVWQVGTFQYTNTLNATKTVKKFTASFDHAAQVAGIK